MNEQEPASSTAGQRVARAAIVVMAAFVISRVLGLVRDIVIARQFATSAEYAAYVAAFRIPDLLFVLVAGGALASAFIPTFSTYLTREREEAGWRLVSAIGTWLLITVGTCALLLAITASWWVPLVFAFDPALLQLTVHLTRIMLISTVIFSVSGLVMSVLHSYQHFLWPSIAPAFYNVGIIAGALVLAPRFGITGLAVGVVVGACAHLVVQIPTLVKYKRQIWPQLGLGDPEIAGGVREVARLMAPRVAGLAVVQLNFIVTTALASYLNPAAVSSLDYAWKIMLLPQGVFAMAVATAAFPTFSEQAAAGNHDEMQHTLGQTLRAILFLTLPAAIGLMVLREPLVTLLFQRGAFDAASTAAVAWALLFYAPGLVGHSLIEISTRAFYALHDTLTPVLIGAGAMVLNLILSLFFMFNFGEPGNLSRGPHGGLALANTIATTLEMFILLWLLRNRLHGLESRRLALSALRLGSAAACMGVLLWVMPRLPPVAGWPAQAVGIFGICVGTVVYFLAAWMFRAEEVRLVPRLVFRRNSP